MIRQDSIVDHGKICSDCCISSRQNFISLVSLHQYVSSCMCILFKFDFVHFVSQTWSYQYSFYIWIHITLHFIWLFIFFFRNRIKLLFQKSKTESAEPRAVWPGFSWLTKHALLYQLAQLLSSSIVGWLARK